MSKNHYISEYLKLGCSGQLQELFSQSGNPYKEITESMSAWKNMKEFIDPKDKNHAYFFIGDGSLCLTGALFAFLSKGTHTSIDPAINTKKVDEWMQREDVRNFYFYKCKFQEIDKFFISSHIKNIDLILVHSHVNLEELIKYFPHWRYLYTNPCCNIQEQTFSIQFQKDNNISTVKSGFDKYNTSPQNMIFVYKNHNFVKEEIG